MCRSWKLYISLFIFFCTVKNGNSRILSTVSKPEPPPSNSTKPPLICKDGREPLLEGDNRIFPCVEECPDGFNCEMPNPNSHGICCPDLEVLYELYGSSEEEITEPPESSEAEQKFEEVNIKTSASTTSSTAKTSISTLKTTPKLSTTPRKLQEPTTMPKTISTAPIFPSTQKIDPQKVMTKKNFGVKTFVPESPDRDILNSIKLKEIRRSEEKKRPIPPSEGSPYEVTEKAENFEKPLDLTPLDSMKAINPTKSVDPTTKAPKPPKLGVPTEAKKFIEENDEFESKMPSIKPLADFGFTCRREKFEGKCKNGTVDTQIVLRWYVKDDMCCSYPYGFCPGATVLNDKTIRSKEECEVLCLRSGNGFESGELEDIMEKLDARKKVQSGNQNLDQKSTVPELRNSENDQDSDENGYDSSNSTINTDTDPLKVQKFEGTVMKNAAALINGGNFAFSVEEKKPKPKKTCDKEQFRAMCPDGMPSQFTIRWFVKDGMCCAYPYGYCHGDSVYEEEVLRSKEECEAYCLGTEKEPFKFLRI